MNPEISVIIPVYNAAGSLERCVESLVYGELQDIEVVLIEDCSKDNSWEVCCDLSKRFKNVHCLKNEKNRGVSFTRNRGLEEVKGKYVLFVDSDDWVSKNYAKMLLHTAEQNKNCLVICGHHFRDEVSGYCRDYLWKDIHKQTHMVDKKELFDLADYFLLQQLWNKIFCRDIIEKYHICFDESQSMGEDFQFVLDYLKFAQIKQCVVLNEALYYYIRANGTSLMSKFGLDKNEKEFERYNQLLEICGMEDAELRKRYNDAIEDVKKNFVYQIAHSYIDKNEKLVMIERIMNDKKASKHYRKQRLLIMKEKTANFVEKCKELPKRMKGKLRRVKRDNIALKAKELLKNENFTIISQNCIGGVFYHDMGMKFLSPTVNMFFKGSEFVRLSCNLKYYMSLDLEMRWEEEYPVGHLDDVTIYFMHYHTCREAKEAWNKRKQRINWEKIVIISTDMEEFNDDTWEEWKNIQYPKILFSAKDRKSPEVVYFSQYRKNGRVPDLIPNREFYKDGELLNVINNL